MKTLTIPERLIVAADFDPEDENPMASFQKVLALASQLQGSGVYIKVNSALRAYGYKMIETLHNRGLKVFADLKLKDIPETMERDAKELRAYQPDILTVMCDAGKAGIERVARTLPNTEVLGVTVLTSIDDKSGECERIYGRKVPQAAFSLAQIALDGGVAGFICSGLEARMLRASLGDSFTINSPGIRPLFSLVQNDDQARIVTPRKAIQEGVTRMVVGRPILNHTEPMTAVKLVLAEIEEALALAA